MERLRQALGGREPTSTQYTDALDEFSRTNDIGEAVKRITGTPNERAAEFSFFRSRMQALRYILADECKRIGEIELLGDIGPVNNARHRAVMKRLGYDADKFRMIQYRVKTDCGTRIIDIFEWTDASGVTHYFDPHFSSTDGQK